MEDVVTIRMVRDWRKSFTPLQDAIHVNLAMFKKDLEGACRSTIYFMAQSASKMVPKGMKERPVFPNFRFRHLLTAEGYKAARITGRDMSAYFKFRAIKLRQSPRLPIERYGNSERSLAKIARAGTGARAWMWTLGGTQAKVDKDILSYAELFPVHGSAGPYLSNKPNLVTGFILRNKLSYMMKIMPSGWEKRVEELAIKKIMGRAAVILQNKYGANIFRRIG